MAFLFLGLGLFCGLAPQAPKLDGMQVLKTLLYVSSSSPTSYDNRTPHVSKHPSRGGAEEKRTRYDLGLGGSSRTIRATGRIIKSGVLRKQT